MIETSRLKIYVTTQQEMEEYISVQTSDILKEAYIEMLNGCLEHSDAWEWYAIWMIELKDGTHIGDLCFKGVDSNGITEIGYGIDEDYQNHGYATEAVSAMIKWAFGHPCISAVEAEAEEGNIASRRVLEKCGFVFYGQMGEEGLRYTLFRCEGRDG